MSILERVREIGIVPVIAISDADKAVPLANALVAGGIPCAEITFRTAEGDEAIKKISDAGKGKHWYNNGHINKFCYSCPEGFESGMLKKSA